MRPRGKPPTPSAMSRPRLPVETVSISICSRLPSFIAEPLPNARSIWASAASSAFCRSMLMDSPPATTFSCAAIPLSPRQSDCDFQRCIGFVPEEQVGNKYYLLCRRQIVRPTGSFTPIAFETDLPGQRSKASIAPEVARGQLEQADGGALFVSYRWGDSSPGPALEIIAVQ